MKTVSQQVLAALLRKIEIERRRRSFRRAGVACLILSACLVVLTLADILQGEFPLFPVAVVTGFMIAAVLHKARLWHARRTGRKEHKK